MATLPRSRGALLVTDSSSLSGTVLDSFASRNHLSLSEVKLIVLDDGSNWDKVYSSASPVEVIFSAAETPGRHTFDFLSKISKLLKNGGRLIVQEPVAARTPTKEESLTICSKSRSLQSSADVERNLILSGFSSCVSSPPLDGLSLDPEWMGITPAYIGSTLGPLLKPFSVSASKPSWETGSSFTLKKKSTNTNTTSNSASKGIAPVQPSPSPASWNAAVNGLGDDLIDEDSLLTPEDMAPAPQVLPDCGNTRVAKKACKNCTCGRAELEQKAEAKILTLDQINTPQSACGSCGLGDAFRCAGCPYRGLPPFKLGEKISISSSVLAADV